jgi:hypothetical protein
LQQLESDIRHEKANLTYSFKHRNRPIPSERIVPDSAMRQERINAILSRKMGDGSGPASIVMRSSAMMREVVDVDVGTLRAEGACIVARSLQELGYSEKAHLRQLEKSNYGIPELYDKRNKNYEHQLQKIGCINVADAEAIRQSKRQYLNIMTMKYRDPSRIYAHGDQLRSKLISQREKIVKKFTDVDDAGVPTIDAIVLDARALGLLCTASTKSTGLQCEKPCLTSSQIDDIADPHGTVDENSSIKLCGTHYRSFRMQRAKITLQQPVVVPAMVLIASPTCLAIKKNGDRCSKPSKADGLCGIHLRHSISIPHMQIIPPPRAVQLCSAVKRDSQRCTKKAKPFSEYCGTHVKMFS